MCSWKPVSRWKSARGGGRPVAYLFLSDAWFDAVEALRDKAPTPPEELADVAVHMVVTGGVLTGAASAMPTPSAPPPPPLPEFSDLVERSEWLRGRAGLESDVLRWHRSLAAERAHIVTEAEELATPRLRRIPFGALFLVIVRFLWFTLVAPFRRTGVPERRAVRWSKHLVQAGGPVYVK